MDDTFVGPDRKPFRDLLCLNTIILTSQLHSVDVLHLHQVHKVPATDMEALKSPLMGIFEKRRARGFFIYVQDYNEADPRTHQGLDLTRMTTKELIA
jgi:RAB protein geranylgeranyltransferase component A